SAAVAVPDVTSTSFLSRFFRLARLRQLAERNEYFRGDGCATDCSGEIDFPKERVVATYCLAEVKLNC
ncbi:MAG: hypothetical protein ACREIW_09480, partial [Chthoniobacterales bacterium]